LLPDRQSRGDAPDLRRDGLATLSWALLEKLVHGSGRLPPNQHYVAITIPPCVTYEMFDTAAHPGWDMATVAVSKPYGEA